jgi:hypothetical protein
MGLKLVPLATDLFGVSTHEAGCPFCNYALFRITVKTTRNSRKVVIRCANEQCGKVVEEIVAST